MKAEIEKTSAITLNVADMEASVRFYRDALGMDLLDGGPNAGFTSLRIPGSEFPIINLHSLPSSPILGNGLRVLQVTAA
jgi:catechol 2,3-dioxygenase-like lactoylglutathione lyase family enzyme